jgi:hypothetical protein
VFHESGERFSRATKQDEGVVKYFARQSYIPFILLTSIFLGMKVYQESFSFLDTYEDYLDWLCFQNVKQGHSLELLARSMFKTDQYSIESRSK